jgi:hypothetical protein
MKGRKRARNLRKEERKISEDNRDGSLSSTHCTENYKKKKRFSLYSIVTWLLKAGNVHC